MNAVKIYPSNPIIFAKGSKKLATIESMLEPFMPTFAKIQIIKPAGTATDNDLPRTKIVLSKIDLTIILPN